MDWLEFDKTAEAAVEGIITNSDSIREGKVPVRELTSGVTGMAVSKETMNAQVQSHSMSALGMIGSINVLLDGIYSFVSKTYLMYIDYENDPYYFPDQFPTTKTAKYVVIDLMGKGQANMIPQVTSTFAGFSVVNVEKTNYRGVGSFTFSVPSATFGDKIEVTLTLPTKPPAKTKGTFYVGKVELKSNDKVVEPDSRGNMYAWIDETPAMPKLKAKLKPDGMEGDVKWRLKIEYECGNRGQGDTLGRGDEIRVPTGPDQNQTYTTTRPAAVAWDINAELGEKIIRGGKAKITWEYVGKTTEKELPFTIRGKNPAEDTAKPIVKSKAAEIITFEPWFVTRLVKQESGYAKSGRSYLQFYEDGSPGNGCRNKGNVKWGDPFGWGMMQVENPQEAGSAQMLWDWQENVKAGMNKLKSKNQGPKGATEFWKEQVRQFNLWIKDHPATPPKSIEYTSGGGLIISFHYDPACADNCTKINEPEKLNPYNYINTGNKYSFRDAIWIKQYNGTGTDNHNFISWYNVDPDNPYWRTNESAIVNGEQKYYVKEVCKHKP